MQWSYSGFGEVPPTTAKNRFADLTNNPNPGTTAIPDVAFNLRYPGQYADKESGLFYNYFRTYQPGTGRYVEEDPIGLLGGFNRHAYAYGNPVSYTDPSGRFGVVGAVIGGVSGAGAGYIAGGWQGAVAGGVIGGIVGAVAPQLSAAAGTFAGSGIAGMLAATGTNVALGAATGAAATLAGNKLAGKCDLTEGLAYGTALGAFAPLMSGEAFIVGAGGELAVGAGIANGFSGLTGAFGVAGAAMDPNASHGFR